MNILFLTTLLPYPLDNGGKIKTYYTLKALAANHKVDVLAFITQPKDAKYIENVKEICNSVQILEKVIIAKQSKVQLLKDFAKSLFTKYPYVVNKFYSKEMAQNIADLQAKHSYDLIYVDHLPMMIYQFLFKSKFILDEHNVESLIMKRRLESENNLVRKALGYIESQKLFSFEKNSLQKADSIIALSEQDKQALKSLSKTSKTIEVIPICTESDYVKSSISKKDDERLRLLFVGTMSWYPNAQGISWFIEEVFLKLDKNKFELYIVGGNPPANILKWNEKNNIYVKGYVDDVNNYIELCHVNIVPIFIGSGLRVKIIEAYNKGIPTISTGIGAEGVEVSHGENILIANEPEEFITILKGLYENVGILNSIQKNALKTHENYYSIRVLAEKLNYSINSQTAKKSQN